MKGCPFPERGSMSGNRCHWLFKSKPSCFSYDDLERRPFRTEPWDGVRNYQARNYLRIICAMRCRLATASCSTAAIFRSRPWSACPGCAGRLPRSDGPQPAEKTFRSEEYGRYPSLVFGRCPGRAVFAPVGNLSPIGNPPALPGDLKSLTVPGLNLIKPCCLSRALDQGFGMWRS
jgi:hypothetical protein